MHYQWNSIVLFESEISCKCIFHTQGKSLTFFLRYIIDMLRKGKNGVIYNNKAREDRQRVEGGKKKKEKGQELAYSLKIL